MRDSQDRVVILSAVRTPIGRFGGAFKDVTAVALATSASTEAVRRAGLGPEAIDAVTEQYFNKRGRDILRRIDKMKYIHGKPMTTQAPPKVYTKPEPQKELPSWASKPVDDEVGKLDKQIDKLEEEWDKLYDLDRRAYKMDLDELEIIIKGLIEKRNRLAKEKQTGDDLPF